MMRFGLVALLTCFGSIGLSPAQEPASRADQWSFRDTKRGTFSSSAGGMVERQLRSRGIDDPRTLRAMAKVPREKFVPNELRNSAYDDRPLDRKRTRLNSS